MGCTLSGLNALYGADGIDDVWVNDNRFRILKLLHENNGSSFFFLVKEVSDPSSHGLKVSSFASDDGTYLMKKVMIRSEEDLDMMMKEIFVSSLFCHPNLLPLLDHAIIPVMERQRSFEQEAYSLFPMYLNANSLLFKVENMQTRKQYFFALTVLHIFRQICAGIEHMHNHDPPYAHNNIGPHNIIIAPRSGQEPLAILMNFSASTPAKKAIRSRAEALKLQEWAVEHCSAPFRAPELWNCPSYVDIDQKTDIWSLGCTLYMMMYGSSPFEYVVAESGGSLQLAIMNAQIRWPSGTENLFPLSLRRFVIWMLQPQPAIRPFISDIIVHIDKLISKISSQR